MNISEHAGRVVGRGLVRPAPFPRLRVPRPLFSTLVCAGFPSPADDHSERTIDLNEELIRNEPATFFFRVTGESMRDGFVRDGDILVLDRSMKPRDGDVVVAALDGEPCVKRFRRRGARLWLESANSEYADIELGPESELVIEGVVTWSLHKQRFGA